MVKSQLILGYLLSAGGALAQWPPIRPTNRPQPTTTSAAAPPPRPGATQSLYGQCGGQNYSGPTACPTGAYCKFDGNIWYSQCVSIEDPAGPNNPSPTGPGVTIRTLTTVFSVGGPTPTVISTKITYLTPRPTTTVPSVVTVTLVPDDPCDHDVWC